MGPGDRQKCGRCRRVLDFEDIWAFTDGVPFCSPKCYMKQIKETQPANYERLSLVLGAVD